MSEKAQTHHKGAYFMPVTPFNNDPNQTFDPDSYHLLISRAVDAGAKSIICGAATGEAFELTNSEMGHMMQVALDAAQGRANIYGSLPWETNTCLELVPKAMKNGVAGFMELPPTYAYNCNRGVEQRYRRISNACDGNLIIYAKGPNAIPSDSTIAMLASEGLICAVKRAAERVAFLETMTAVKQANPSVLVIQGAAERFLLEVSDIADGYTTGTGLVFPKLSVEIEKAFLEKDRSRLEALIEHFLPMELVRAEHGTGYNIAPLKWALYKAQEIGNGKTRPRFMSLLKEDEMRVEAIACAILEIENSL